MYTLAAILIAAARLPLLSITPVLGFSSTAPKCRLGLPEACPWGIWRQEGSRGSSRC